MRRLWILLISSCFNPTGTSPIGTESNTGETTDVGPPTPTSSGSGESGSTGTQPTTGSVPTTSSTGDASGSTTDVGSSEVSSGTSSGNEVSSGGSSGPMPECGDGVLQEGEECEPPVLDCSPDCLFETKYLFVSSTTKMGGALGTLEEMDALCQSLAQDKPVIGGREFVAWLSNENTPAKDRIGFGMAPYKLPDNLTVVAQSTIDLLDGSLQNAIVKDETGTIILTDLGVWTGTLVDGSAAVGKTCASWMGGQTGLIGQAAVADSGWTADSQLSCSQPGRIYCIEKSPG